LEYTQIAAPAKREKALIFYADESGVRSDHHAGTTWAPRGHTPVFSARARGSNNDRGSIALLEGHQAGIDMDV